MTSECQRHQEEIAAAAGADLPAQVQSHVDRCESCARFRESTLSMARIHETRIQDQRALAIARSALTEATSRRPLYWIAPLLSASATAAGLILYFGLTPQQPASVQHGTHVSTQSGHDDTTRMLPDDLRALSDTILFPQEDQP